jgi:CDP-diacylglycerol--glycerol-3-phosphate 3-phosphatidyltransferase
MWLKNFAYWSAFMTPRVDRATISLAFGGVSAITGVAIGLGSYSPGARCVACFVAGASATWLVLVATLARVRRELSSDAERGQATISAATAVTIARGFLVALVAGWVLSPAPAGAARWIPGALYALAALADRADGALARRTGSVTALGAKLDVTTDAVGLFVAPLVAVRWGRLPPWYLLLALAYPAFRLALRLRRARDLPLYSERLERDPRARFFAGVQMTLVAAALLPPLPRALTWTAATLAMLPTLALFAGQWRLVTSAPGARDDGAGAQRLDA